MIDFSMLDMIIIGLILFLSLKGFISGLIKEFFNFTGLIGGVYFASRLNIEVGEFISSNIFPLESESFVKLAGFVSVFLAIWMISNFISSIFEKTLPEGVDIFSRILGYALTVLRYIAIFAIIVVSLKNVDTIAEKFAKHSEDSSIVSTLNEIGADLLNMNARESDAIIDLQAFKIDANETNKTKE